MVSLAGRSKDEHINLDTLAAALFNTLIVFSRYIPPSAWIDNLDAGSFVSGLGVMPGFGTFGPIAEPNSAAIDRPE